MHAPLREASPSLIDAVLDAATEVHRQTGPGLLEAAYELALCHELALRRLSFDRQPEVPFLYKGQTLATGFRADLIVEGCLLLELKCVETLHPLHIAQVLTYLRLLHLRRGYLLNFHCALMKQGIKRISL